MTSLEIEDRIVQFVADAGGRPIRSAAIARYLGGPDTLRRIEDALADLVRYGRLDVEGDSYRLTGRRGPRRLSCRT